MEQLAAGLYPITIKTILQYEGDAPLPSAQDYYQKSNPEEAPSILIKKGSDVSKRKRTLKRILQGDTNPLASNQYPMKLVNQKGQKVEEILLEVNEESAQFLNPLVSKTREAIFSRLENSKLLATAKDLSSVFPVLKRVLNSKQALFYILELQDQNRELLLQLGEVCALTLLLARRYDLGEEQSLHLARASFFQAVGDNGILHSEQGPNRELADRRLVKILESGRLINLEPETLSIIQKQHEVLIGKNCLESKLLQCVSIFSVLHFGGIVLVEDLRHDISSGLNLESSMSRLIQYSNARVNITCSEPVLEEAPVNKLAALLGFTYLVDREREIRVEILESCDETEVLGNRASVICHHKNLDKAFVQEHSWCEGQGSDANVLREKGKSEHIAKCSRGCAVLSQINLTHKR